MRLVTTPAGSLSLLTIDARAAPDALLLLRQGLFDSEFEEAVQIGGSPCRAAEPKELVKVNFNLRNGVAAPPGFVDPISKELEPFIISVGEIGAHGSSEGGVILRADHGEPVGEHDVSSIETTPEVIKGESAYLRRIYF
jgi:hypothetical protein